MTLGSWDCEFSPLVLIGYTKMHCIVFWHDCVNAISMIYSQYCIILRQSLYCTIQLQATKKETISTQYTLEYVTWPHEAKTYVNSILSVLNWSHTHWCSLRDIHDSCVYCLVESVLRRICGVWPKWLTLLRFVFRVLKNLAIVSENMFKLLGKTVITL